MSSLDQQQAQVWCRTDTGLRRDSNQDSFLVNQDLGLYVVADGMGGHLGGEVASSLAVKTAEEVVEQYRHSMRDSRDLLAMVYQESSRRIFEMAEQENPRLAGMGTTMVCAYTSGSSIFIGNVGDSRAYLFRKPYLWQLTEDHSLVNEQLRAGLIREDQVRQFVGRNVITRSVGFEKEVVIDVLERTIQKGDGILLCSDGLSGLVTDRRIQEILCASPQDQAVNSLIQEALANGGDDNVTVLYLCF